MTTNPLKLSTLAILLLATRAAMAQSIDFTVDGINVRATALSETAFRLSVNADGEATPRNSVYIDPARKDAPAGTISTDGTRRTIKTARGALTIDTAAGTYALLDASGKTIAPATRVVQRAAHDGKPALALHVGWPAERAFSVYGSGNGYDTLAQRDVKAHVDNGIAVEPFFWAPAGFATLVVGANDNDPARCDGWVTDNAVTWAVSGAAADLYLMIAPTLADAPPALLALTGRPPVPPRWTFGYLQSRWGWSDRAYVDDTLKQFADRKLPVDAFIFDFEWYTKTPDYEVPREGVAGFSDFTFNDGLFDEPTKQIDALHDAGVRVVGIRKPRIGNDDTLKFIRDKHWDIASEGGDKWNARALDFWKPDLRAWYADQTQPLLKAGIDGWWNDEGEFTYTTYAYWNAAERAALDAARPNARHWSLNRAFAPGTSRSGAAAWTGDVQANWDALQKTPAALLNWSLAGMPYGACDIGGFHGAPAPELLVRWMQAGTCMPIMRSHSEVQVPPHFPWLYGPDAERAIRAAVERRYRLVPMLYSLAHECHDTGMPLIRPLTMAFPGDASVADNVSEWMLGPSVLSAPVLAAGGKTTVTLPAGDWYDFATNERLTGPRDLHVTVPIDASPMYVRAGSILPLGPLVQHTRDLPGGPLELRIYPGRDATFTLVEDDGETQDYLRGAERRTTFTWKDAAGELSWKRDGAFDGASCFREIHVVRADAATTNDHALSAEGSVVVGK